MPVLQKPEMERDEMTKYGLVWTLGNQPWHVEDAAYSSRQVAEAARIVFLDKRPDFTCEVIEFQIPVAVGAK